MLLVAVFASLATGALAGTIAAPKLSTTIKSSSHVKTSPTAKLISSSKSATTPTKSTERTAPKLIKLISSRMPAVAPSKSTERVTPSIASLIAKLSTARANTTQDKFAPLIKSKASSPATLSRAAPPAVPMIANKYVNLKILVTSLPVASSFKTTTYDPVTLHTYDYDEPEDLVHDAVVSHEKLEQPKSILFQNEDKSENFLQEIKDNLQRGNDDYLELLNGRRSMNLMIARPKHVQLHSREGGRKSYVKGNAKQLYNARTEKNATNNTKKLDRVWLRREQRARLTGLTTPSKYQVRRYRNPMKRKRKQRSDARRLQLKYAKHRNHIRDRKYKEMYHEMYNNVKRRHDLKVANVNVTAMLSDTSKEDDATTRKDLASVLMLHTITEEPTITAKLTTARLHLYPRHKAPTLSVATRPSVYDVTTKSTTKPQFSVIWNSIPSLSSQTDLTFKPPEHELKFARKLEGVITTPSAYEIESSRKQKKLERFVKFINKNRGILRQFISKKHLAPLRSGNNGKRFKKAQREKSGKGAFFRGDTKVNMLEPLHPHQLDLSPGRGARIEGLRQKGRLCQRNVLIPEGPKYNSLGAIYMPEFVRKKGAPDYPTTKKTKFLIPICCNCCKKSVLGCE